MSGELGLIDPELGTAVGDAYRAMRKLQHQLRLQAQDNARLDPAQVEPHSGNVLRLWEMMFGS
ncbi:hypothetical protein LP419_09950 [Massilia sp. H-1]|nr:hypothetical protein LP419_09950 [Massilia sp. H-1]